MITPEQQQTVVDFKAFLRELARCAAFLTVCDAKSVWISKSDTEGALYKTRVRFRNNTDPRAEDIVAGYLGARLFAANEADDDFLDQVEDEVKAPIWKEIETKARPFFHEMLSESDGLVGMYNELADKGGLEIRRAPLH